MAAIAMERQDLGEEAWRRGARLPGFDRGRPRVGRV